MKRCIIIEDQLPAQGIIKHYLQDFPDLELQACFTNALEARHWLVGHSVDLIFLDIHLPRLSGMDFLRNLKSQAAVILTTAFPDYALESYEFRVIDYLLKPIAPERFQQAIEKFRHFQVPQADYEFMVKSGYDYQKVSASALSFIKSDMDYTELHLDSKIILSKQTLNHWAEKLSRHGFLRAHRSYLVNIHHVAALHSRHLLLQNDISIPLGRAYKEALKEALL